MPTTRVRDCRLSLARAWVSQTGRAVRQAAEQYGVASAVGVELSPTRHERAVASLRDCPWLTPRVNFAQGDCAGDAAWAPGGLLAHVTDVWLCSLLFDATLMGRLAARIEASGTIERVATLKPFPDGLRGFAEDEDVEPCDMSWTAKLIVLEGEPHASPVHIYQRE